MKEYTGRIFDMKAFEEALAVLKEIDVERFRKTCSLLAGYAPMDSSAFAMGFDIGQVDRCLEQFQKAFAPPAIL